MNYFSIKKTTLAYQNKGKGKPALLFIHGNTCTHKDWIYQIDYFKKDYQVIAPDLRFHGASTGEVEDCLIQNYATDTLALLDLLDIAAAVIIGHSFGIQIVLEIQRIAPERVEGIVLLDGSKLGFNDPEEEVKNITQQLANKSYRAERRAEFLNMLSNIKDRDTRERLLENNKKMPKGFGLLSFQDILFWDATYFDKVVSAIKVPLLLIQSTYLNEEKKRHALVEGTSASFLKFMQRLVPTVQIAIIKDTGHFAMVDEPNKVNHLIEQFIQL